jgi:hypothetical protein
MTTKNRSFQIFRFVQAAGIYGGGSVGLAIVCFVISIIEHFIDKNINEYWFVLAGAAFFAFGAYTAWAREHDAYTAEVEKNAKPSLKIELNGSFFDVSKIPNKNELQTHIYAYLRVTNLTTPETVIKDGTLDLTVDGISYHGVGDDISVKGNTVEHVSDFKLVGEVKTEVFGNTLSRFPRLSSVVNANSPLRRGITQEGFFAFTFADLKHWNSDNEYVMPAAYAKLTLRDSFDEPHSVVMMNLNIPSGMVSTKSL